MQTMAPKTLTVETGTPDSDVGFNSSQFQRETLRHICIFLILMHSQIKALTISELDLCPNSEILSSIVPLRNSTDLKAQQLYSENLDFSSSLTNIRVCYVL